MDIISDYYHHQHYVILSVFLQKVPQKNLFLRLEIYINIYLGFYNRPVGTRFQSFRLKGMHGFAMYIDLHVANYREQITKTHKCKYDICVCIFFM